MKLFRIAFITFIASLGRSVYAADCSLGTPPFPTEYMCNATDVCNNPSSTCRCDGQKIGHTEVCQFIGGTYSYTVSIGEHTHYALSGTTFSLQFTVNNTGTSGQSYAIVNLPLAAGSGIRYLNASDLPVNNIALGLGTENNPIFLLNTGETKTITITGIINTTNGAFSSFRFGVSLSPDQTLTAPYITKFGTVLPIADLMVSQVLFGTAPSMSGDLARFYFTVVNIGSAVVSFNFADVFPLNFLASPTATFNGISRSSIFQSPSTFLRTGLTVNPGSLVQVFVNGLLSNNFPAGTTISNTGYIITTGSQLSTTNDSDYISFTTPAYVDLRGISVTTGTSIPQLSGDSVSFVVAYQNFGNIQASGIQALVNISGTNISNQLISLPNIPAFGSGTFTITGIVNNNYTPLTEICFSGSLTGANENGLTGNNTLSGACLSVVGLADLAVSHTLITNLSGVQSGSTVDYQITLTNSGSKNVSGITLTGTLPSSLRFTSSSLPVVNNGTVIVWSGISLNSGASTTINLSTVLTSLSASGLDLPVSFVIGSNEREVTLTNNTSTGSSHLSGLADVYLTVSSLPFSGFIAGDMMNFSIVYGNRGDRPAQNVVVQALLPSQLQASQTTWNLGTINPGTSTTINFTPTLSTSLAGGTSFATLFTISTSDSQSTMSNDSGLVTTTIQSFDGMGLSIQAYNQTRGTYNPLDPNGGIQAVSGDRISLTIRYRNNGNVVANNARVQLSNLPTTLGVDLSPITLGTLGANQSGSYTVSFVVPNKNFKLYQPTITVLYNNNLTLSRNVSITEPLACGDGLITQQEQCDIALNSVPFAGQSCEQQQGQCVLVTKYIENRACVQYGATNECSTARIDFQAAGCQSIAKGTPLNNTLPVSCYTTGVVYSDTPIAINCGNGTIIRGFGKDMQGTIFAGQCPTTSSSNISCQVGNDTNNPSCVMGAVASACTVEPESSVVIVDEDDEGEVEVTCETPNNIEADIEIDCGQGGDIKKGEDDRKYGSRLSTVCEYEYDDEDIQRTISCKINNSSTPSCTNSVIVDQGILGVCGDRVRQGYEQCDAGNGNGEGYDSKLGKQCYPGCTLNTPPACLSVNTKGNLSLQPSELLPFAWRLQKVDSLVNKNSCNDLPDGSILDDSLKCTFKIYDGKSKVIETIQKDCLKDEWGQSPIFNDFRANTNITQGRFFTLMPQVDNFGEYRIVLDKVEYKYCDNEDEIKESYLNTVCQNNFVVTKPYLVQKSAFGITPKATNIDLKDFYDMKGDALVNKTDLKDVMVLDADEYQGGVKVDYLINEFLKKYGKLAVTVDSNKLPSQLKGMQVKKVPNADIYIINNSSKETKELIIDKALIDKPFTIITNNINLKITGNIDVNGMFLVDGGEIYFNNPNCDTQQVVRGIFITTKGFNSTDTSKPNTNLTNAKRCDEGGLYVKGVLIGNNIETLVSKKRSQLNDWFKVVSNNDSAIRAERRNEIFRGASVLIEYSPSLRENLPPGASDFTKSLEVYKK